MYSTNYNDFAVNVLPPNHRQTVHKSWVKALVSPMVWANTNFFEDFLNGSSYAAYNSGTTYGYQDRVIYMNAVYESKQASNTGNAITDTDWWFQVQANYIGVYERIKYNSTKIVLEYALNKWFGGTFRQPNSTSDIYITKNASVAQSFVVGLTEDTTSASGADDSTGYVGDTLVYAGFYSFTINIPTSLYPSGGDEEIKQFLKNIVGAHATYNITQY